MIPVLLRFYQEHRRLLTALLAVLAGNVLFYLTLGGPAQLRVRGQREDLRRSEEALRAAHRAYGRAALEARLLTAAEAAMTRLATQTFRTSKERFATVDATIKELAAKFRLEPHSINYGYTPQARERLEELSVAFNLKGGYDDLRHFVAEVEQASGESGEDLFFVIDRVSLADSTEGGTELNLTITVKTYFHKPELATERVKR